jgi:hypothetical protein
MSAHGTGKRAFDPALYRNAQWSRCPRQASPWRTPSPKVRTCLPGAASPPPAREILAQRAPTQSGTARARTSRASCLRARRWRCARTPRRACSHASALPPIHGRPTSRSRWSSGWRPRDRRTHCPLRLPCRERIGPASHAQSMLRLALGPQPIPSPERDARGTGRRVGPPPPPAPRRGARGPEREASRQERAASSVS